MIHTISPYEYNSIPERLSHPLVLRHHVQEHLVHGRPDAIVVDVHDGLLVGVRGCRRAPLRVGDFALQLLREPGADVHLALLY